MAQLNEWVFHRCQKKFSAQFFIIFFRLFNGGSNYNSKWPRFLRDKRNQTIQYPYERSIQPLPVFNLWSVKISPRFVTKVKKNSPDYTDSNKPQANTLEKNNGN